MREPGEKTIAATTGHGTYRVGDTVIVMTQKRIDMPLALGTPASRVIESIITILPPIPSWSSGWMAVVSEDGSLASPKEKIDLSYIVPKRVNDSPLGIDEEALLHAYDGRRPSKLTTMKRVSRVVMIEGRLLLFALDAIPSTLIEFAEVVTTGLDSPTLREVMSYFPISGSPNHAVLSALVRMGHTNVKVHRRTCLVRGVNPEEIEFINEKVTSGEPKWLRAVLNASRDFRSMTDGRMEGFLQVLRREPIIVLDDRRPLEEDYVIASPDAQEE